jgi:O-antigen ligase
VSDAALRWASPRRLFMLPLAALAVVLTAREALGIQAGPLLIIAAFFAAALALLVVAHHPAAFIAPVLFLPRLKEVGILSRFGPASNWTALQLACGLVAIGVCLRWLAGVQRKGSEDEEAFSALAERQASIRGPLTAFVVFAAVVACSYLYTAAPHYGSQKLLAFATLGCSMFFAPLLLFTSERDFWDFTVGTVLFGTIVAASSLSFSATGAMGAEDNPSHIGKGQVIGLAILLLIYTPIRNKWLRAAVLVLAIPALAIGLVSAETRGPLFSLLFVLGLSFCVDSFRSPVITRRQMAFVGVALVAAVMLVSTFWFYGAEASKFKYKAAEILNLVEDNSEAKGTAVERLVFYRAAIELWTERPVFGWGVGGWSMAYWQNDMRDYPHNLIFEMLVEEGLVGLLALLLFFRAVFRHLGVHQAAVRKHFPCLLPGLVYLISIAMFSGDLDDDRFIWFWCGLALAGCSLAARQAVVNFSSVHRNMAAEAFAHASPADPVAFTD